MKKLILLIACTAMAAPTASSANPPSENITVQQMIECGTADGIFSDFLKRSPDQERAELGDFYAELADHWLTHAVALHPMGDAGTMAETLEKQIELHTKINEGANPDEKFGMLRGILIRCEILEDEHFAGDD